MAELAVEFEGGELISYLGLRVGISDVEALSFLSLPLPLPHVALPLLLPLPLPTF